ncbi:hypothetical protein HMPREF0663_12274 [Hoylesella oralis ATCC 33269]|uniref:Uncharacterized protein n=1 Tax=Hoylesella oralis ATCC 33269 TaxID=873533 RepID=E7RSK6_9BACT|nr:hypothetical protein HMPREF0663_12274 [Hoylesella oralis ATCC 33269]
MINKTAGCYLLISEQEYPISRVRVGSIGERCWNQERRTTKLKESNIELGVLMKVIKMTGKI